MPEARAMQDQPLAYFLWTARGACQVCRLQEPNRRSKVGPLLHVTIAEPRGPGIVSGGHLRYVVTLLTYKSKKCIIHYSMYM